MEQATAPGTQEHLVEQEPDGASAWSTAAWVVASLAVAAIVFGAWMAVQDQVDERRIPEGVRAGDRPAAAALPTEELDGDGAPGLPGWYASEDGLQVADLPDGEVLVVNWWASWCGPCEDEAPALQRIADEYADRGVTVVGLDPAAEDAASDARAFVERHEIDFPILRASQDDRAAWGATGYPETFIVGVDGRVTFHVDGPVDEAVLSDLLDEELEQRPVDEA